MIWWTFAVALGVSATVELVKQTIPWPLAPWSKSFLSLVLSSLSAWWLAPGGSRSIFVMAMAAFGLAPILHGVEAMLRLRRDDLKSQVMVRSRVQGVRR